jgi:lipopolysaccharide transport system ATP-binding protein
MSAVITLDSVSKHFHGLARYGVGIKSLLLNPSFLRMNRQELDPPAVNDVSFAVGRGETFGILGRNGAGKSTLLGLIGGILRPSSGRISIEGRICPLLELGAGFVSDLTGRENILLNGILLGLRRRQVVERTEEIIEFSGLRRAIDHSLKTYSSGMQMRLGFSIAVHAEPDILLVDEVLAVGDAEFQEQCLARIAKLRADGVTIVFVSHDLATIDAICDRAAWLDQGRLIACGEPKTVVAEYQKHIVHVGGETSPRRGVGLLETG